MRNYMTLLSIGYILMHMKYIHFDAGFRWYILYVTLLVFLSFINGDYASSEFWRTIVGYHIVCIILYIALTIYVRDNIKVNYIVGILFTFYLVNGFITILQFNGNPTGWLIGEIISPQNAATINEYDDVLQLSDSMLNYSLVGGLWGYAVANGYFTATYLPIVSMLVWNNKKEILLGIFMLIYAVVICYMVQQRMAFILVVLYILFIIFTRTNLFAKILLFIGVLFLMSSESIMFDLDMGRLNFDQKNEDRLELLEDFDSFLDSGNVIFGGYSDYINRFGELGQHNTFLDVWTRSGFVGLLAFCVLFAIVVYRSITIAYCSYAKRYYNIFALSISCIIFLLYSMTHSSGLQSGAVIFWLPYTLMMVSYNINMKNI